MKIAVVGTGYVGLVTGTCLAEKGHTVACVDVDKAKIEGLNKGVSPIYEPGLDALIADNVEHERLSFTTQLKDALAEAKVCFIAVGTPEGEDGSADLKYVEQVATDVGQLMTGPMVVVVKSTVPVGTCDRVEAILAEQLKKRGVAYNFSVASNPEFLKEGKAIADCMKPDRIVVGLDDIDGATRNVFLEMYEPLVRDDPGKLMFMNRRSSELTKYGANAMLATRISFMNELSRLCEAAGANIDDVRLGIGSDSRIGRKFLYSGPGYGGSCFPKDVAALIRTSERHEIKLEVLNAVMTANQAQKQFVADKVLKHFNGDLKDKRIAVWGLAFKPGTDDVRETPALTIIETLLENGAAVYAHDPEAKDNFTKLLTPANAAKVTYTNNAYDALEAADAMVLVTEWPFYQRPNWEKVARLMRTKVVFDFRNQYNAKNLKDAGFHYGSVGRGHLKG